jgi:hypothetical protein
LSGAYPAGVPFARLATVPAAVAAAAVRPGAPGAALADPAPALAPGHYEARLTIGRLAVDSDGQTLRPPRLSVTLPKKMCAHRQGSLTWTNQLPPLTARPDGSTSHLRRTSAMKPGPGRYTLDVTLTGIISDARHLRGTLLMTARMQPRGRPAFTCRTPRISYTAIQRYNGALG